VTVEAMMASELLLFAELLPECLVATLSPVSKAAVRQQADIRIFEGETAVEDAAPVWLELQAAGAVPTPFQTLAFARRASGVHLRQGEIPRIAAVYQDGRPVALSATVLSRVSGVPAVRFLGDPLSQYGDAVICKTARREHLQALWHEMANPKRSSLVMLRRVRACSRFAPVLQAHAKVLNDEQAPFIALGLDHQISSHERREQSRRNRRLAEAGAVSIDIINAPQAAEAVAEAINFKLAWLAERGLPSSVLGHAGWQATLIDMAKDPDAPLTVVKLSVAGVTAAMEVAFTHGGNWLAFLGATNPAFAKAGPGHIQMEKTIAHCRAANFNAYDLLAPNDAYKSKIATGCVAVRDFAAALDARGHMALWTASLMPAAKSAVTALPRDVRRVVVSRLAKSFLAAPVK